MLGHFQEKLHKQENLVYLGDVKEASKNRTLSNTIDRSAFMLLLESKIGLSDEF